MIKCAGNGQFAIKGTFMKSKICNVFILLTNMYSFPLDLGARNESIA